MSFIKNQLTSACIGQSTVVTFFEKTLKKWRQLHFAHEAGVRKR